MTSKSKTPPKIIQHPMSHLFTAEEYKMNCKQKTIVFHRCYLHNRFYYSKIEWDIPKNILRFYQTNGPKKEIKCVKLSLENCNKEPQIMDSRETRLFMQNCKQFMYLLDKFEYFQHLAFRRFTSDPNKLILFIGETHQREPTVVETIVDLFLTYLDSFRSIPGMIIDFFNEVDYNTHALNFKYKQYAIYTALYENLRDSSHVRYHQIDYRSVPNMEPLLNLYWYLKNQTEKEPFRVNLRVIHAYVLNIKTLLDPEHFKKTFPILLKQYRKINKVLLLIDLFKEFFEHIYKETDCLQENIEFYWETKHQKKKSPLHEEHKTYYWNQIYSSRLLDVNLVLDIFSRFMDIYSIGRLLKPGYNFCVVYAGAFHTIDVMKTLQTHGYLMQKDPLFIEKTDRDVLESLKEYDRPVFGDNCMPL